MEKRVRDKLYGKELQAVAADRLAWCEVLEGLCPIRGRKGSREVGERGVGGGGGGESNAEPLDG